LLSRRGDTFLNRRIPIEDIPWGMDIRHDERWRDTPSDWTFEDFGFAGRGFRPM
uniref:3-methyladenine DNA glycosylase n=1 Tax=Anisakis simplex TaxID=6269 RepID=A0A0M3JJE2_ANISI